MREYTVSTGSKENTFDYIVIGAGPAASTFAREAAEAGFSILVIDGKSVMGKKPCGGLLAPDAQKLMAEYDFVLPKTVLVDPQIFSVKTIDLSSGIERSYQRYYLNMDRDAFDEHLLALVPDNGLRVKGRCVGIEKREDGKRFAVRAKLIGGETVMFFADNIVGADGASSIVRSTLFDAPMLKYIAIQQWFKNEGTESPYYSCIFDRETSEGCSWTIHKDGYLIYGGCFERRASREAFEKQKVRFEAYIGEKLPEPEFTEACLVASPRKYRDFVTGSGGVWLIGEAAGFISASSLEGISSAVKSGSMLAGAVKSARSIKDLGQADKAISSKYARSAFKLKLKLLGKVAKHHIIFSHGLRQLIMKSGIQSIRTMAEKKHE